MTIGFTGTRTGMSEAQRAQLRTVLDWLFNVVPVRARPQFHHGDCHDQVGGVSADHEAAQMAVGMGFIERKHVPDSYGPAPLLARNRAIVAASDILIAAPESDTEQRRSGTWATVRYARQKGIPIVMLSRGTR